MSESRTDPLDELRIPPVPVAPDPAFAADLRDRLRTLLAPVTKEPPMSLDLSDRPRNGARQGDISYITLGLPDLSRGRAFYGSVLGWRFLPGQSAQGVQVDDIAPMMGLWGGDQPDDRGHGAVLAFRVDDIAAAVAAVRAHGGSVTDPHPEPYAVAAEGQDDQGIPFYLHQMAPPTLRDGSPAAASRNGQVEGDVSYVSMVVPDLEAARKFYGAVLGWTFPAGGTQVSDVAPEVGMITAPKGGPAGPGVVLCYRVVDINRSVERVRGAGGRSGEVVQRPYGLESLCADDQGIPFYLHQL